MPKNAVSAHRQPQSQRPTSYQVLGMRVMHEINSPVAQNRKTAMLKRCQGDSDGDWDQLLDEMAQHDNVRIDHRDDGSVQVFWTAPKD